MVVTNTLYPEGIFGLERGESERLRRLTKGDFIGPQRLYCWMPDDTSIDRILTPIAMVAAFRSKTQEKKGKHIRILDLCCGSGLASYLFAERGVMVLALDTREHPRQREFLHDNIRHIIDKTAISMINYDVSRGNTRKYRIYDAVYCSWMPFDKDWSGIVYRDVSPPVVVHVLREGITGLQPQVSETILPAKYHNPYELSSWNYVTIDSWRVPDCITLRLSEGRGLPEIKMPCMDGGFIEEVAVGIPHPPRGSLVRVDVKKKYAPLFEAH